jgi:hypothetical protein
METTTPKESFRTKFQKIRYNRNLRTIVLVVLLAILLAMYFLRGKMKWLLLGLIITVLLALGIHVADYDLDLGTLFRTGNIQESRVETKKWVKIIWSDCTSNNLNCSDFKTQWDAQNKYESCADKIAWDNTHIKWGKDDIKRLDIYGLDWDKDGTVCEALPQWAAVTN